MMIAGKDADDRNHREQFDERETTTIIATTMPVRRGKERGSGECSHFGCPAIRPLLFHVLKLAAPVNPFSEYSDDGKNAGDDCDRPGFGNLGGVQRGNGKIIQGDIDGVGASCSQT